MANKLITKYTWSDNWALYNTRFNKGQWVEDTVVDEASGEETTYYTMATFHIIETKTEGNKTTITYAGLRVNDLGKFLIELLANSEPLSFDDIVAATCAEYGCVSNEEIIEVQTVVDDFLTTCVEDVLVVNEYVTVAYIESLAAIADDELSSNTDTNNSIIADSEPSISTFSLRSNAMSLDSTDDMLMTAAETNESPETGSDAETGSDVETGSEEVEVDYDALINGSSKDPVNDILNLKIHRIDSADWQGEKEYINYQYAFKLTTTSGDPTSIHGITMTSKDGTEFIPKFILPDTNRDILWGYVIGNILGLETYKLFQHTVYNRDTLYEYCCTRYSAELESGETTLTELLDMCTTMYNVMVVAYKVKKALLVK